MSARLLPRHAALNTAGRFHLATRPADAPITSTETLVLLGCGIGAAVGVLLLEFKLKLPGHAILRAVPPMALGLSLVPRRGSGTVMGIGALAGAGVVLGAGLGEKGYGSLMSLALIGPVLDLAIRATSGGKRIYLSFLSAGLLANLAALATQASLKYFGLDIGSKPLALWLPLALVTYPAFGAAAGLLSAAICFRWNDRQPEPDADQR